MGIFTKAMISGEEIKNYIPQREPIIMVDAFYGMEENRSYTGLAVTDGNIFVEDGLLNESGIIEHIAQSCAVRVGYVCRQKNMPFPIGYIGALKNIKISALPRVGQRMYTTVDILQDVFDITLVSVEVKVENIVLATGEMKIFLHTTE